MVEAIAVIPARLQSKRLNRKLLLPGPGGKPLLYFTWSRAKSAKSIKDVWIATDNTEIEHEARKFGANVVQTSGTHTCGTDRVREAYDKLRSPTHEEGHWTEALHADIIINVQGDEPEIRGQDIDKLVLDYAKRTPDNPYCIGTLAVPFTNFQEYTLPQNVKAVFHKDGEAIYFSRGMIPWISGTHGQMGTLVNGDAWYPTAHKHIGVYAYTPKMLKRFVDEKPTKIEQVEGLEQLRAIENRWPIYITTVLSPEADYEGVWPRGVNTKQDYQDWLESAKYF